MSGTIVVVEDEESIALGLKDSLEIEGYAVQHVANGQDAVESIVRTLPDLVVLDLMLPVKDGYQVCREVRQKGVSAYIIMLTAKKEEMDKIMGFNAGADDYMVKPFSLMELLAKIKAVFKRLRKDEEKNDIFRKGALYVDFKKYEAQKNDETIELSAKEFEILRYFTSHAGEVVSRDDLLNAVWGYDVYPTTRTVDNFIVRIRQKIENNPENPQVFISIRGAGYKFCPEAL
ncbi:MAG: DNA-binding response regulator [Candidatus Raymondbacteria bacterium RifOxyA12_full_50_37]|uniref:DNA-binding response regulator n=1 Tax=Candidatus Raymondbacteria bacterium RIFOXYD12_FULL_49_13 TaxID=1817890 RepID=A0A1F7F1Q6_UNCRA|nr:MAG: DNA-binding response regulator [Candidatus Raymondbacteria bacterium RifOxyA12_full_50_37]OGJ93122.1 MAG: DNA-binding response regulator [Candidatus Raymondbacteria bacterium RifOxyB12_full_50_8]OGJ93929.1 MAG: DNA-binding response regulator [Candidatus Raymondbacteria bacterium RIFOXYA2_FULL_49_16]OGJ94721.1 MAG: DNA-binding response regulator [Candidatus Raymondbacteria bacterium RifOxyC12_full_50_8]OGJ98202.1 MAG: DNA-binding response regulator [Candidatus Raymondbacteria bacterium R